MQTELMINRGGFPPFAARDCQQILRPLVSGNLRRTVNGQLMYLGLKGHHKYQSIITCQDQAGPAFENIWRGEHISLDCVQRLCQEAVVKDKQSTIVLQRSPVRNSIVITDQSNESIDCKISFMNGVCQLELPISYKTETSIYISYRPILQMRVTSFQLVTKEWQQECGWRLECDEI